MITNFANVKTEVERFRGCECELFMDVFWATHDLSSHIDLFAMYSENVELVGVTESVAKSSWGPVGVYALAKPTAVKFRAFLTHLGFLLPDGGLLRVHVTDPGGMPPAKDGIDVPDDVKLLMGMCYVIGPRYHGPDDPLTIKDRAGCAEHGLTAEGMN